MSWKTAHRSFYYQSALESANPDLRSGKVALLVIDVQNTYLELSADPAQAALWAPFHARMRQRVAVRPYAHLSGQDGSKPAACGLNAGLLRFGAVGCGSSY